MNLSRQFLRWNIKIAFFLPLLIFPVTAATAWVNVTESKPIESLIAQSLKPSEISLRAKQFTVRIDGTEIGTGVIVDEIDNVYVVLTNWHVVQQAGEYSVQAVDGRKYSVNYETVRQLPNLDLAILQFESQQNYQLAEIGNSNSLNEGTEIYFAGYPGELRSENNRYYRFFPTNLSSILLEPTEDGYSLVYGGEPFPGMSGGPVMDEQGLLIGIHGQTNIHAVTQGTSNYAIPISSYQSAIAQLNAPPQDATTINPAPTNSTEEQTPEATPTTEPSYADTAENSSVIVETIEPEQPTAATNPGETAEPSPPTEDTATATTATDSATSSEPAEPSPPTEDTATATTATDSAASSEPAATNPGEINSVPTLTTIATNSVTKPPVRENKPELLSRTTGIDYTNLKQLLVNKQWQEADRQTQQLVSRIIDTAKRQNRHTFITINMIADYACADLTTIDALWQQYSDSKLGFTPQKNIWLDIQQQSGFSPNAWRSFATKIGWKQGEVSNNGGYLLYEQLTFEPQNAPQGHLPWWFAAPDEQQNIIKTVFNRCSFQNEVKEKNPAESGTTAETSQDREEVTIPENSDSSN